MAAITVNTLVDPLADSTVSVPALTAATASDTLANDGETVLVAVADGTNRTVTITGNSTGLGFGKTAESSVVTVNASKTAVIGPFPPEIWGTSLTVVASNIAVTFLATKVGAKVATASDVASIEQLGEMLDNLLADSAILAKERRVYKRVRRAVTIAHRRLVGQADNPADHI